MLKIYKASAGSGKTFTLAYEYIRTLLGVKLDPTGKYRLNHSQYAPEGLRLTNRHRHILAITFTNKATEEMKRRIINELDSLAVIQPAGVDDSDYASMLCKEFGCGRQQLADSASKALEELLDAYSDFNVTTIDSFFQRVLRTFARELDCQGDFAIEINDNTALQMTVNTMLDDFNRNPQEAPALKQWLVDFLLRSVEEGGKTNFLNRDSDLYSRLIKLTTKICDEKFKDYSEKMRAYLGVGAAEGESASRLPALIDHLYKTRRAIIDRLAASVNQMWNDLAADGITPDMMPKSAVFKKLLTETIPNKRIPTERTLKNKTLVEIISGTASPFNKNPKVQPKHVDRVRRELINASDSYVLYGDYQTLLNALPQLSLLAYAWKYLDGIISDNNTVLLSDTNHLVHRIIGADETPFIYERMGVALTNFLIDEFQDTSKMQWENLKPLVAQSLADGHDNLIIGDEKQSIYRFRNSDSSLLHTQVADVDFPVSKHYDTRLEGDKPGQNTNWRSAAEVVRFNNSLFTALAKKLDIEGYENVIQQIAKKNADLPAYVRFINSTLPPEETEEKSAREEKEEVTEIDIIDRMAADIRRQHTEGGYRWADIAVLVTYNVEGAKIIERFASKHKDIPVMSSDSMLVRKSSVVMMVVAILRIYSQAHSTRKITVRHGNFYPDQAQTAAIISQYKYLRKFFPDTYGDPYDAIVKATETAASGENPAEEVVRRLIRRRPSSLVSLIETIIHEFVSPDEQKAQSAYIAAFVDFAIEWGEKFPSSLTGFLDAWEQQKNKLSVTSGSDIDAVTVTTIHKSKGLEYDCVHIPFGSWREAKGEYELWIPFPKIPGLVPDDCPAAVYVNLTAKAGNPASIFNNVYTNTLKDDLVDTLNKTYVAYTRAARELTVYYDPEAGIGAIIKQVFDSGFDSEGDPCLLNWPDDVTYDSDTGNLVIGAPTHKRLNNKPKRERVKPGCKALESYEVAINNNADIYTRVDDMLDDTRDIGSPDDDPQEYRADDFIDEESRLRGIALHDIISRVITADDAQAAVRYHSMRNDASAAEEDALLSDIQGMLEGDHPKISQWFAPEADVLTEQTIYMPDSGRTSRIDRIVRYPDGSVDIIDYKFTSRHRAAHSRQVSEYIGHLTAMGYGNVRGYLWYPLISPDKIIQIINQTSNE